MINIYKLVLNVKLNVEVFECQVIELLIIIGDDSMRKSKLTDDQFPKKKILTLSSITCAKDFASTHLVK